MTIGIDPHVRGGSAPENSEGVAAAESTPIPTMHDLTYVHLFANMPLDSTSESPTSTPILQNPNRQSQAIKSQWGIGVGQIGGNESGNFIP